MQWVLGTVLIMSSLGIILAKKPVLASLSFLVTLLTLATIYLQLSAQFIAVMQVLVYAGAILVIFMFVMVLFQDAHAQLEKFKPQSSKLLLLLGAGAFLVTLLWMAKDFLKLPPASSALPANYGTVQAIGESIYVDFFFPFEAVIMLFLVAIVGALYMGKKRI